MDDPKLGQRDPFIQVKSPVGLDLGHSNGDTKEIWKILGKKS
jgi:hypothetical protein